MRSLIPLLLLVPACTWTTAQPPPVDPTPAGTLDAGTAIYQIGPGPSLGAWTPDGWTALPHDLALTDPAGRESRGAFERVMPLAAGGFVFCGSAYRGTTPLDGCWQVAADGTSTVLYEVRAARGAAPVLTLDVDPDGTWLNTRTLDVGTRLEAVPASTSALRAHDADRASTGAIAALVDLDGGCALSIHDAAGATLHEQPVSTCIESPRWRPDGGALAFHDAGAIHVWEDGSVRSVVPASTGPDGAPETLVLVDWSPDGTRLLIQSSRYHRDGKDLMGHLHRGVSTYTVDAASGAWTRLEADVRRNGRWAAAPSEAREGAASPKPAEGFVDAAAVLAAVPGERETLVSEMTGEDYGTRITREGPGPVAGVPCGATVEAYDDSWGCETTEPVTRGGLTLSAGQVPVYYKTGTFRNLLADRMVPAQAELTVVGVPCTNYVHLHPDGSVQTCTLRERHAFGPVTLPAGTDVTLDPGGSVDSAVLYEDFVIEGKTMESGTFEFGSEGAVTNHLPGWFGD